MHGPPPSAASGSGSSVRNPALPKTTSQSLPLSSIAAASPQNVHSTMPQGANHTLVPSKLVYPTGNHIVAGSSSTTGYAATSHGSSFQPYAPYQSPVHGLNGYLPPQHVGTTADAPENPLHELSEAHPNVDLASLEPLQPELPRAWDRVFKAFLARTGLTQALRGFEADMLVINADFERDELPGALEDLRQMLNRITDTPPYDVEVSPLEKRKLDNVHHAKGAKASTPGSINRSISQLLSRKRARNDASNQSEFLINKRFRSEDNESSSAARADAKVIDRDAMMKFDIAKNDEGPLRRTMQPSSLKKGQEDISSVSGGKSAEWDTSSLGGLDERMKNLEEHLAIRYVPSAPVALPVRLQLIEDYLVSLEREYPPWAALHFNQPRRGWPAPPRPTPVVVPSHLTSTTAQKEFSASLHEDVQSSTLSDQTTSGDPRGKGRAQSSLQRAVLEKLEVQKALTDIRGSTK